MNIKDYYFHTISKSSNEKVYYVFECILKDGKLKSQKLLNHNENKYIVIQCVYTDDKLNEEEQNILSELHYKKIDISDAIYVVNVNGYIGSSTAKEIQYAKTLGKEIMYLEPIK